MLGSHDEPRQLREHHGTQPGSRIKKPSTIRGEPHPITIRLTADTTTKRLLGAQLAGTIATETAKRVDTYATAIFNGMTIDQVSDLDLSYTPPFGSPWDAAQIAAQDWMSKYARPSRRH